MENTTRLMGSLSPALAKAKSPGFVEKWSPGPWLLCHYGLPLGLRSFSLRMPPVGSIDAECCSRDSV